MPWRARGKRARVAAAAACAVVWWILADYGQQEQQQQQQQQQLQYSSRRGPCAPRQHVMFLKTHKCASSSVQNILLRYAYKHNLTLALPARGNYLGNPQHFKVSMVPPFLLPAGGKVDLFALHSRLNVSEHGRIMHSDTAYVTVIRNPPFLFESFYNYYELSSYRNETLNELLQRPLMDQLAMGRERTRFGPNQMLFDLGVEVDSFTTAVEIRHAINAADQLFDIVLVAEHLDEGLILLKDHLCWDYKDIVYFDKNVRHPEMVTILTQEEIDKLQSLNSGDMLLYEHFLEKHRQAVVKFGVEEMKYEVSVLKYYKETLFNLCGIKYERNFEADSLYKEYSEQVIGYLPECKTCSDECMLLTLPELSFVNIMREKMKLMIREHTLREEML